MNPLLCQEFNAGHFSAISLSPSLPLSLPSIHPPAILTGMFPIFKTIFFHLVFCVALRENSQPPPHPALSTPEKDSIKPSFYPTGDTNASTRASFGLALVCSLLSGNPSKITESSRKPQLLRLHMDHLRGQIDVNTTITIQRM